MFYFSGPKKPVTWSSLYNRDKSSTYALHCTAYFGGRQPHPLANSYARNPAVTKAIGRYFPVTVVGIIITPKTVGARVKLDEEMLKLWKRDEDEDGGHGTTGRYVPLSSKGKTSKKDRKKNKKQAQQAQSLASRFNALQIDDDSDSDKNSDKNSDSDSGKASKMSKTSSKTWDFQPTSGVGSRAHLTLGYAPGGKCRRDRAGAGEDSPPGGIT